MISIRAACVIPEEVPEPGEEEVVVLPEDEAVLALEVVGLPLRPVEPLDTLVHVRPEPLSRRTLAVSLLGIRDRLCFFISVISCYLSVSTKPVLLKCISNLSYGQ